MKGPPAPIILFAAPKVIYVIFCILCTADTLTVWQVEQLNTELTIFWFLSNTVFLFCCVRLVNLYSKPLIDQYNCTLWHYTVIKVKADPYEKVSAVYYQLALIPD